MEDALGRFHNCSDDDAAKTEFTNSESQKKVWKKMIKKRIEFEVQVNELIRLLNLSVTGMKGDGSNNKNDARPLSRPGSASTVKSSIPKQRPD